MKNETPIQETCIPIAVAKRHLYQIDGFLDENGLQEYTGQDDVKPLAVYGLAQVEASAAHPMFCIEGICVILIAYTVLPLMPAQRSIMVAAMECKLMKESENEHQAID